MKLQINQEETDDRNYYRRCEKLKSVNNNNNNNNDDDDNNNNKQKKKIEMVKEKKINHSYRVRHRNFSPFSIRLL